MHLLIHTLLAVNQETRTTSINSERSGCVFMGERVCHGLEQGMLWLLALLIFPYSV